MNRNLIVVLTLGVFLSRVNNIQVEVFKKAKPAAENTDFVERKGQPC